MKPKSDRATIKMFFSALLAAVCFNLAVASASSWSTAELPYVHDGPIPGRYIQAHGHVNGAGPKKRRITVTLRQYYGGNWHGVGSKTGNGSGSLDTMAYVFCTKPYTNYSWSTETDSWTLGPTGWISDGVSYSRVVMLAC
jgi:hypothetical protein